MRLSNIFACLVTLGVATATPVYGASLSFVPTGTQLDNDSLDDIEVNVGDSISFTLELDTTGLSANLNSFNFLIEGDRTELGFINAVLTDDFVAVFPNADVTFLTLTEEAILVLNEISGPGISANTSLQLGTYNYTVLPGLSNDGLSDFAITVTSALDSDGADVTGLFDPVRQEIEIQASPIPESTPIMGLLLLGVLGVGSLLKNSLRKLVKARKI